MAPPTLSGSVCLFTGSTFTTLKAQLSKIVKNNDGTVASGWSKKVTHVIVPKEGFTKMTQAVLKAFENSIPVINEDWLLGDDDDTSSFQLKAPTDEPAVGAGKGNKRKAADEDDEAESSEEESPKKKSSGKKKVDEYFAGSASVHEDFACMLMQSNVSRNNNKFYVIQLLKTTCGYHVFTRWGRVGEPGRHASQPCANLSIGIREFEKKFKSKTGNNWANRDNFVPKSKKYTPVEIEDDDEDLDTIQDALTNLKKSNPNRKVSVKPCSLPDKVQQFLRIIFNDRMMEEQMQRFDLNTKEMPLGKLSQTQIQKGFTILEELEDALNNHDSTTELTNQFYTVIPHSFGRRRPPVINSAELLQKKKDMLNVLSDIEVAQKLTKEREDQEKEEEEDMEVDHPLDAQYKQLDANLEHLDKSSEEFKMVDKYVKNTMERKGTLMEVYKVSRNTEGERFKAHEELDERKLLFHGTNIAVVVSCIKGGLRIMPHSGGRVGKGLYLADMHGKSAQYTATNGDGVGIMFLMEGALGKIHDINRDDPSLRTAPSGYHSIVARGWKHPDPAHDLVKEFDGKRVVVPQGKPVPHPHWNSNSSFAHNEYLVYEESQACMRYILQMKFDGWY